MKNLNGCRFTYNNETLEIQVRRYYETNAIAIVLDSESGPYAKLTVNIPETILEDKEILVKTWAENEGIAKKILQYPMFIDTGKRIPTGYVEAQIWKISDEYSVE